MADLKFNLTPADIQQAIDKITADGGDGPNTTLSAMLALVNADIGANLEFPCPNCGGSGLIEVPVEDILNPIKETCPVCYGYGKTIEEIKFVKQYLNVATVPTVEQ